MCAMQQRAHVEARVHARTRKARGRTKPLPRLYQEQQSIHDTHHTLLKDRVYHYVSYPLSNLVFETSGCT